MCHNWGLYLIKEGYLQFVDKLIMTYSKWYSIPGAVDEQKPP